MFVRSLARLAVCDAKTVERYLKHLSVASGEEVVALGDILPTPRDGAAELTKFHKLLIDTMSLRQNELIGVQVQPLESDVLRILRATDAAHWPLFRNDIVESGANISKSEKKIQYVEGAVMMQLNKSCDPVKFTPALYFTGSRYTYFAPHAVGLAADRGGLVALCHGEWQPWNQSVLHTSFVVSRDNEPVRVGNTKVGFQGDLVQFIAKASKYASAIGMDLTDRIITVSGFHARQPISTGRFDVNFGPYGGEVSCRVQ